MISGQDKKNKKAFTLLEVIVAVAIMDIIALMLYSSLYIAMRAKNSSQSAIEPYNIAAAAFEYMRSDLNSIVQPGGELAGDFEGVSQNLAGGGRADIISFYCANPITSDTSPRSNIINIQYSLQNEQDDYITDLPRRQTATVLSRTVTTNLLAPAIEADRTEILARSIRSLRIRYYDGQSWVENWNSSDNDDNLPAAVEVTLVVGSNTRADSQPSEYSKIFILGRNARMGEGENAQR